jgi:CHRD domain
MRRVSIAAVLALLAVVSLVVLSGTSADEGGTSLRASLSGFQESPPKLSPGSGTFTATLFNDHLNYKLTYSGLSSSALQAHIHFGQRAVSAGIFIWLCQTASNPSPTAGTPMCPAGGGTVTGTANAASVLKVSGQTLNSGNFNDAIAIIRSGEAYVNVHTTNFPGGEIRGQVQFDRND